MTYLTGLNYVRMEHCDVINMESIIAITNSFRILLTGITGFDGTFQKRMSN